MEMIGIYGAAAATANSVAQIQIPRLGRIRGLSWTMWADLDADLEFFVAELSFLPVLQSLTNNTRNLIWSGSLAAGFTTSGMTINSINGFTPMDLRVTPLQIVYLNFSMTGTASASFTGLLHFD